MLMSRKLTKMGLSYEFQNQQSKSDDADSQDTKTTQVANQEGFN